MSARKEKRIRVHPIGNGTTQERDPVENKGWISLITEEELAQQI